VPPSSRSVDESASHASTRNLTHTTKTVLLSGRTERSARAPDRSSSSPNCPTTSGNTLLAMQSTSGTELSLAVIHEPPRSSAIMAPTRREPPLHLRRAGRGETTCLETQYTVQVSTARSARVFRWPRQRTEGLFRLHPRRRSTNSANLCRDLPSNSSSTAPHSTRASPDAVHIAGLLTGKPPSWACCNR
jgi:hypothetical protein